MCIRDRPNHEERLKAFEKINSWQRAEFLENGDGDRIPGQNKTDFDVARSCSAGLELLVKKQDCEINAVKCCVHKIRKGASKA